MKFIVISLLIILLFSSCCTIKEIYECAQEKYNDCQKIKQFRVGEFDNKPILLKVDLHVDFFKAKCHFKASVSISF